MKWQASLTRKAKLKEAGHAIAEEVQAAGLAIEDARKQRAECVVEARAHHRHVQPEYSSPNTDSFAIFTLVGSMRKIYTGSKAANCIKTGTASIEARFVGGSVVGIHANKRVHTASRLAMPACWPILKER